MKFILNHDRKTVLQMVAQAPDGHSVEIKPPNRTADQNALYWAELGALSDKAGQTPSLWHEYFKRLYLKPEVFEIKGEVIMVWPSTTKLSRQEFSDYLEQVFAWIAENVE